MQQLTRYTQDDKRKTDLISQMLPLKADNNCLGIKPKFIMLQFPPKAIICPYSTANINH